MAREKGRLVREQLLIGCLAETIVKFLSHCLSMRSGSTAVGLRNATWTSTASGTDAKPMPQKPRPS